MRSAHPVLLFSATVLVVAALCSGASAQGCGLGIVTEDIPCTRDPKTNKVTSTHESQTCEAGGAGASPTLYCGQGYGVCGGTNGTELEYFTATLGPDSSCAPLCQPSGTPPYNPPRGDYWDYGSCSWQPLQVRVAYPG